MKDRVNTDTSAERVAVISGSTRPTRICPGIAKWTRETLSEQSLFHYQLIDLAEINLPLLDEPLKAALRDYQHEHEHTKACQQLRVIDSQMVEALEASQEQRPKRAKAAP